MEDYVFTDTIIFFISNIILAIYVFKNKKLDRKEKIAYTIFFIILNSSFNIMMKKIHNYNMAIPRTYIYRKKLVGPISALDIICIFFIIINLKYLFNIIKKDKLVFIHLIRCAGIYIIGTISFLIFKGYWMDNGNDFLMNSKGWVYSLATLIFTYKYMNKNINLIWPFAIILLNGWISTIIVPISDMWIRYGHRTIIIDQEDAYTISNCIITLLMINCLYIKGNIKKQLINCSLLALFIFQNMYCMYKTNFIILPMIFIIYLILTRGKNYILSFATALGIPTMILLLWNKIYEMLTSLAMQTRSSQIQDYLNYIQDKGIYPYFFGTGISTPYYSAIETNDTGERKAIDLLDQYSANWKVDLQTPIISIFKDAGIIGIIYFLIMTLYIVIVTVNMLNKVLKAKIVKDYEWIETFGFGIYLLVSTSHILFFYGGSVPYAVFYTFVLAKFVINCKKIMKKEENNENINN